MLVRILSMKRESVWDYPRPPAVEKSERRVRIVVEGVTVVDTTDSYRILETSHPPVFYISPDAVTDARMVDNERKTFCEFKGVASYTDLVVGDRTITDAAWFYRSPSPGFEVIADRLAFYPSKMGECWVDDDLVVPQQSDFYGGWITPEIEGPFKGS